MNLQEINQLYNETNKDMSRQEFVKEVQQLTDSRRMQSDLQKITAIKQTRSIMAAREKQKIDGAMKDG